VSFFIQFFVNKLIQLPSTLLLNTFLFTDLSAIAEKTLRLSENAVLIMYMSIKIVTIFWTALSIAFCWKVRF